MKKNIKVNFFSHSKKWPRRIPKIKKITYKTLNKMSSHFGKDYVYYLNLILSNKNEMTKLNKRFKSKNKDTDVLTFVNKIPNKNLGKILYCDIFFSIDTIEGFINKNNINLYDHFNHLLVHSLLHVNGYEHNNQIKYKRMKNEEIKILKKFDIQDPYINQ